jgi:hypothetical protein
MFVQNICSDMHPLSSHALTKLTALIHPAHSTSSWRFRAQVAWRSRKVVFHYFGELRKIIELAKQDVLFADP